MNLGRTQFKALALAVGIYAAVVLLIVGVDRAIVRAAFDRLEESQARQEATRVRLTLDRELLGVRRLAADWANWDDMARFAVERNPEFIQANLADPQGLARDAALHLCMILSRSGEVLHGHAFHAARRGPLGSVPELVHDAAGAARLAALAESVMTAAAGADGIVATPDGPILTSLMPIRTTAGDGPVRGLVLMGRHLDAVLLDEMRTAAQVQFDLVGREDRGLTAAEAALLDDLDSDESRFIPGPGDRRFLYGVLSDVLGEPTFLLRVPERRDVAETARRTSLALVGALAFAALAVLLSRAYWVARLRGDERSGGAATVWGTGAMTVLIGLGLSAGLARELHLRQRRAVQQRFAEAAGERASAVRTELASLVRDLSSVQRFFSGSDRVDRAEFRLFVRPLLEDSSLQVIAWLPRVSLADRAAFEADASRGQGADVTMLERDPGGGYRPAQPRAEAFPMLFRETSLPSSVPLGFDSGSEAVLLVALDRAIESGRPAVTERIDLRPVGDAREIHVVYLPVYAADPTPMTVAMRRQALVGLVAGSFSTESLVRTAMLRLGGDDLAVFLRDATVPAGQSSPRVAADHSRALSHGEDLAFGQRFWRVEVHPTRAHAGQRRTLLPIWVLAVGSALTLLLALLLIAQERRTVFLRQLLDGGTAGDLGAALLLRRRIVVPMLAGSAVVAALMIGHAAWRQRSLTNAAAMASAEDVWRCWPAHAAAAAANMGAALRCFEHHGSLEKVRESGDGDALHATVSPLFRDMRDLHGVTHLAFYDAALVCRARLDDPKWVGHRGDRQTLGRAVLAGTDTWGVEPDDAGRLVLWCVRPWGHDGRRLGFIEAGMEIQRVAERSALAPGDGIAVLWQPGRDIPNRSGPGSGSGSASAGMPRQALGAYRAPAGVGTSLGESVILRLALRPGRVHRVAAGGRVLALVAPAVPLVIGETPMRLVLLREIPAGDNPVRFLLSGSGLLLFAGAAVLFLILWTRTGQAEEHFAAAVAAREREHAERLGAEAERGRLREHLMVAQRLESVGRLAGGVAHDYNNMLQAILGHVELLIEQAPDGHPMRSGLLEIRAAGRRSAELTRQLLTFARRQAAAPVVIDLNASVTEDLAMLRRLIREDIELVWDPGGGVWPVRLDPVQLTQVLTNLVANARDAIADVGRIAIRTTTATLNQGAGSHPPDVEPGEYALLTVSDTGSGMAPEVREHLFEPFFTTKPHGQGTGLGLATVYGIIRQNHGFVSIDSQPGEGTCVAIYLPRVPEPAAAADQAPAASRDDALPRGRETVLVVEDDGHILSMVRLILSRCGYAVLTARTPAAAIDLADSHQGTIDLLIADVVLPGMNGRTLRDTLAARRPGMTCLFISGYSEEVVVQRGVSLEGVAFLRKPFSVGGLAEKVRAVLAASREGATGDGQGVGPGRPPA